MSIADAAAKLTATFDDAAVPRRVSEAGTADQSRAVGGRGDIRAHRRALKQMPDERLTPLFEHLGGEVPYDQLRVAMTCLRNAS